jgi:hypothetical protein
VSLPAIPLVSPAPNCPSVCALFNLLGAHRQIISAFATGGADALGDFARSGILFSTSMRLLLSPWVPRFGMESMRHSLVKVIN